MRGNVVDDVSGGGILIGVLAPDTTGENRGNRVENNWIRRVGADYHGSAAINLEQTLDTTVAHNQVDDVPYSGIPTRWSRIAVGFTRLARRGRRSRVGS